MKKILAITALLLSHSVLLAQDIKKEDINTPGEGATSGSFGSVVNESNGKVNFSFPVAKISARAVDYSINFNYDGSNVFKQASFTSRHMPTGVLGVGWNTGVQKIVADTKMTSSRDDDTFYLNGIELVCINRPYNTTGYRIWEFKPNKQLQYVVKYYEMLFNPGQLSLDYWQVTDEKGYIYTYGNNDNTRESVLAWGNWIGDGTGTGASKHTITWNLAKIQDQYNNNLLFSYLKVEQGFSTTSLKHTEASYLQQIISSTGEKIIFEYANKSPFEYYEPHTEVAEPDAYQERYEKSYLTNVKTYSSGNELISNYVMGYNLVDSSVSEKAKRFLTSITEKNLAGNNLPPNTFQYNTSGDFKGSIMKWTKPEGGSITYNYEKKFLFTNNNATANNNSSNNHGGWAKYTGNDYYVTLGSPNQIGNGSGEIQGSFFMVRDSWDGRKWNREKFDIPVPIRFTYENSGYRKLDNAKFVFGDDFYGVLVFDRNSDYGNIYLFHRMKDGTWTQFQQTGIYTWGADNGNYADDPVLISGDEFVAVGVKKSGGIYTYTWNGLTWQTNLINQGSGKYFYASKNNFIISLNTETGTDMPVSLGNQNTGTYGDRYYIHFLNAEKKWKTRSWSDVVTQVAANISEDSYFYPSNAMASFVAGNNSEFFLRWDNTYGLGAYNIDAGVLGAQNDIYPIFPIANNLFSSQHVGDPNNGYCYSFKQSAYTGSGWITQDTNIWSENGFGQNMISGSGKVYTFNPNTSLWTYVDVPPSDGEYNEGSYAFGRELFIAEDHIFRISNSGYEQILTLDPTYPRQEFANSGGEYVYVHSRKFANGITGGNVYYYYVDKTDNSVKAGLLQDTEYNLYWDGSNRFAEQFSGKYPFFSERTINRTRLIDNVIGQNIYDNVLSETLTDDGNGNISKIKYVYSNSSHTLRDDRTVIYDTVTITEAGLDTGITNGYTKKYFDTGVNDFTKAGTLIKTETYNANNTKIADIFYATTKFASIVQNSFYSNVAVNYTWKVTSKTETSYLGGISSSTTKYSYDSYGNMTYSDKLNSTGILESSTLSYADATFPFVDEKNFRGFLHKKINKVGTDVVSVEKINWTQNGNNVYISNNESGTSENNTRINSNIQVVDAYGNILQTSNGLGVSTSVLMGYNHKYAVATVPNVTQAEILSTLSVSYATLQTYDTAQLKIELLKLCDYFPLVSIDLFDSYGRKTTSIDSRKNETNYQYDEFGRLKYLSDKNGKIIKIYKYNYKNQ